MTEVSRRSILQAGAWAAPVLTLAAAAPAAAASQEAITLLWTPNPTTFGTTTTLVLTIPESSPYIGQLGQLAIRPLDQSAGVHTITASWPPFFDQGAPFQVYTPDDGLPAGTFVFQVSFANSFDSPATYSAVVRIVDPETAGFTTVAESSPLAIS